MDRRSTLIGLGAVPLILASKTLMAAEADGQPPGDYVLSTLQYGTVAKATSLIAQKRSGNEEVKQFAHFEVLEQSAAASALTSEATPKHPALTIDQKHTIDKVSNAADDRFDAVYLRTQIDGHRMLLMLQDMLIAKYPQPTTDHVHIALILKAFTENHLTILHELLSAHV